MKVLITGATSGIGEAFARALQKEGHSIIAVGRNKEKLLALRKELGAQIIQADLKTEEGLKRCLGKKIDMLINNAGLGFYGNTTPEQDAEMVLVNVHALTQLTNHYISKGNLKALINLGSVVSFFPLPGFNTYAATKSYVLSYTIALSKEHPEINIQCLCPGATSTQFFTRASGGARSGPRGTQGANDMETPAEVVRSSLAGLKKKKVVVISGVRNQLMVKASGMMSKEIMAGLAKGKG